MKMHSYQSVTASMRSALGRASTMRGQNLVGYTSVQITRPSGVVTAVVRPLGRHASGAPAAGREMQKLPGLASASANQQPQAGSERRQGPPAALDAAQLSLNRPARRATTKGAAPAWRPAPCSKLD